MLHLLILERGRLHDRNHSRICVIHWLLHSGCFFNGLTAAVAPAKKRLSSVHNHWLFVFILLLRTQHDLIALIIEWIIVVGRHHFVIVVSGGQCSSLWHEQALCIRLYAHVLRRLLVRLADLVVDISIKLLVLHRIILLQWLRLVMLFVLIIQCRGRSTILLLRCLFGEVGIEDVTIIFIAFATYITFIMHLFV